MRGQRREPPFNPFIVLSDVTISTLVILACLLILFTAGITRSARLERERERQALEIVKGQNLLCNYIQQDKARWPKGIYVLNAVGLQTYLARFPDNRLFDPHRPGELSPLGRQTFRTWGEWWAPRLQELQNRDVGALIEVQIQGHCDRAAPDPWGLSVQRATAVANRLRHLPEFPAHLLSVSGYAWHRQAHITNLTTQERRPMPDRIDIWLIFAGGQKDNTYVCPWDGTRAYGPVNAVTDGTWKDYQ
jgi:hypothetical protein